MEEQILSIISGSEILINDPLPTPPNKRTGPISFFGSGIYT